MNTINYSKISEALASLPSDHDASGEYKPTVDEIFAPQQHANALDPYTTIVVGARGTGKSFWAGVLAQKDTRDVAAQSYPNLGLEKLLVAEGYNGFLSTRILQELVPEGQESKKSYEFWQASIIMAIDRMIAEEKGVKFKEKLSDYIKRYSDPEDADLYLSDLDDKLEEDEKTVLITFDALDKLSKDWSRSNLLLDSLFEVVWDLRIRKRIRAKIFIRPEQFNDDSLKFVEIPKLRSSRVELEWTQIELYGLLFSRLGYDQSKNADEFLKVAKSIGAPFKPLPHKQRRNWNLVSDKKIQKDMMTALAGPYMGKNFKKGGTYDWPYKHLADANGDVTPRSFLKLFSEAGKFGSLLQDRAISAEGIRHGLREASKVRVEQLVVEYQWVKRALAPLAGLRVPCTEEDILSRWEDSNTIEVIMNASQSDSGGFLPPYPYPLYKKLKGEAKLSALADSMAKIGLFEIRADGRFDIPDLFRVAAKMLKKGGITPTAK
ncbi:hypothetical protein SMETP3_09630 [Serratia marcescens]|uniref:P-loop ATPase, Sll1717 family n=1 Tax=Serratia TaxID=613 RepID=UPI0005B4AA90|nr:hypothetical protein [Serratia sp. SCBI]BEN10475.1 hypothetical protein SMETP3_09630 [Serratia marcescens]